MSHDIASQKPHLSATIHAHLSEFIRRNRGGWLHQKTINMGPLRQKVAILECGKTADKIIKVYGGYGGACRLLLENGMAAMGLSKHDLELDMTIYMIYTGESLPDMDDVDVIILTGSRYNAFDDTPWIVDLVEYTRKALEDNRIKILAVCFGHQIVGRALGLELGRCNDGWELSIMSMNLTDIGKEIFARNDLNINQMHRDIIFPNQHLPEGVQALGSTKLCQNHGMYKAGKFLTIQGHPEFLWDMIEAILDIPWAQGVFTADMVKEAKSRMMDRNDGVLVGKAFINLLISSNEPSSEERAFLFQIHVKSVTI